MNIMIIYASIEGQTAKIAAHLRDQLSTAGHIVSLFDTADRMAHVDLDGIDKIILAAPVHERRHPPNFELLLNASSDALEALPSLMLSISLNAAFVDGREEAEDYIQEMVMRTGFKPTQSAIVAGAVKTGSYDYFATEVVRHVLLGDRPYDPNDGDREFTDWDALDQTVTAFLVDATPKMPQV